MSFLSEAAELFRWNNRDPASCGELAGSVTAAVVVLLLAGSPLIAFASFVAGGLVGIAVKSALAVRWRNRRPY